MGWDLEVRKGRTHPLKKPSTEHDYFLPEEPFSHIFSEAHVVSKRTVHNFMLLLWVLALETCCHQANTWAKWITLCQSAWINVLKVVSEVEVPFAFGMVKFWEEQWFVTRPGVEQSMALNDIEAMKLSGDIVYCGLQCGVIQKLSMRKKDLHKGRGNSARFGLKNCEYFLCWLLELVLALSLQIQLSSK